MDRDRVPNSDQKPTPAVLGADTRAGYALGLRLAPLELMRACEQTAVLASLCEGRRIERSHATWLAAASLGGYLWGGALASRLVMTDGISATLSAGLDRWTELGFWTRSGSAYEPTPILGRRLRTLAGYSAQDGAAEIEHGSLYLDLCVTPIDGKRALGEGIAGSTAVVVAAAEPGLFLTKLPRDWAARDDDAVGEGGEDEIHAAEQEYLVALLSPDLATEFIGDSEPAEQDEPPPDGAQKTGPRGTMPLGELRSVTTKEKAQPAVLQLMSVLNALLDLASPSPAGGTTLGELLQRRRTAVLDECLLPRAMGLLKRDLQLRQFSGSSVALGLAVLRGKSSLGCMLAITEHAHACQLAVGVRSIGGALLAVPIRLTKKVNSTYETATCVAPIVLTHRSFVRSDKCLLVATGISEHLLFSGVRHKEGRTVFTVDTVCVGPGFHSFRASERRLDLSECRFLLSDVEGTQSGVCAEELVGQAAYDKFEKAAKKLVNGEHPKQRRSRGRGQTTGGLRVITTRAVTPVGSEAGQHEGAGDVGEP